MFYITPFERSLLTNLSSVLADSSKACGCCNNFKLKDESDKTLVAVTLPGVKKEDIKISVDASKNGGRVLTVKYTERDAFDPEKTSEGNSQISLPESEYGESSASYENGLLIVTLKKVTPSSADIQIA